MLSEKQMHFLASTPCCCMLLQPQKIPHHLRWSSCTKPAWPFWELLRSCLPSTSPVIFLVYSGLPRGSGGGSFFPVPTLLQHCTSCLWALLPQQAGFFCQKSPSFFLFGQVNITNRVYFFFPIQHFFLVQNNWFLGDLWVYWRSGYEADYEMAWKFYRDFSPAETLLGAMLTCLTATTRSMPTDSLPLINCGDKAKLLVPHSCTAWPPRSLKAQRDASLQQIRIYPPHTAPAKTHLRLSWAQTASTRCVWESTCSEQLKTPLTEVEILTLK